MPVDPKVVQAIFKAVQAIFLRVVELPATERPPALNQECGEASHNGPRPRRNQPISLIIHQRSLGAGKRFKTAVCY